jgi:hypothetical protein
VTCCCYKLVAEHGDRSGTQRKGNVQLWSPLPSNSSEDVTVDTGVCVCVCVRACVHACAYTHVCHQSSIQNPFIVTQVRVTVLLNTSIYDGNTFFIQVYLSWTQILIFHVYCSIQNVSVV